MEHAMPVILALVRQRQTDQFKAILNCIVKVSLELSLLGLSTNKFCFFVCLFKSGWNEFPQAAVNSPSLK